MTETRSFQFANNARATLAAALTAAGTSLTVTAGYGDRFPSVATGEIFSCILFSGNGVNYEIVYVTARGGDVFTIERAKEGTTALAFQAGSVIIHNVTAEFFDGLLMRRRLTLPSLTGSMTGALEVTLNWTAAVPQSGNTVTAYSVYRSDNGGAFVLLTTVSSATLQHVDTTLITSSTYSYRVTATTSLGGESAPSNTVGPYSTIQPAAWDPATHTVDIILSGSNYVATRDATAAAWRSVRATVGKSSGKWQWELLVGATPVGNGQIIGAAKAAQSQTSYPGDSLNGVGAQSRDGAAPLVYSNGASTSPTHSATNYTVGDIITFAFDLDALTLEMYINNVLHQQWLAATGLSAGTWYPCVGMYDSGRQFTLQQTLTYPRPGYSQLVA